MPMQSNIAAPFTVGILVVTALVSLLGFSRRDVLDALIFSPYQILRRNQYHRMITSGFLHADLMHLGFNALSLYSFAESVEVQFGAPLLASVYFSSMLGGNLLALILHRNQNNYLALGASGGVCGVIFASIFLLPGGSIMIFPIPVSLPTWAYAVLFPIISMYGIQSKTDNVGHDAHLGGAIVGLLVATVFHPEIVQADPKLYAAVMGTSVAFFVYLVRQSSR
jgi:membrane associated rhomboid family serine protease